MRRTTPFGMIVVSLDSREPGCKNALVDNQDVWTGSQDRMNTVAMEPIKPTTFLGRMGMARADITPPPGINNRVWGAALHETADGVHMPLTATALVILPESGPKRVIISADLCWIGSNDDWLDYRLAIAEAAGISGQIERVLLSMAHTHAAPPLDRSRVHLPGGDLIAPYMAAVREALCAATKQAVANATEAQLTMDVGSCRLAKNRDLLLDDERHFACGFNPHGIADDTLVVGRITDRVTGRVMGTLVNYACHPTTLAWENKLISPDFVGTMRTTVEAATRNAPCLFLQGASGELSAQDGHQGDVAVAERQGRQLGYAVLSTLEGMIPAEKQLDYGGIKESGAKLAYWRHGPLDESAHMREVITHDMPFAMPIKRDWPTLAEFETLHAETEDRVLKERYFRRIGSRKRVGDGAHFDTRFAYWRLGDLIITTTPTEMYSDYQMRLREAFPDHKIIVCNLVNGSSGYVVPAALYDSDLYQADLTPFAEDSLTASIEFSKAQIRELI